MVQLNGEREHDATHIDVIARTFSRRYRWQSKFFANKEKPNPETIKSTKYLSCLFLDAVHAYAEVETVIMALLRSWTMEAHPTDGGWERAQRRDCHAK
jgi:hypothetical protein